MGTSFVVEGLKEYILFVLIVRLKYGVYEEDIRIMFTFDCEITSFLSIRGIFGFFCYFMLKLSVSYKIGYSGLGLKC